MRRNSNYILKSKVVTQPAGTVYPEGLAPGEHDLHDVHVRRIDARWPLAKTIVSVTPTSPTTISEGTTVNFQPTITGVNWLSGNVIYYEIETTVGSTITDADFLSISGSTTHNTVLGQFTLPNSTPNVQTQITLSFCFKPEFPADNEGNKFKFKVYRDSNRTDLMGESAEVTVTDVTGVGTKQVYYTLRENRFGSNIGTITHFLADTSGNIIHTFGTTSGNNGNRNWLFKSWSTTPDTLAVGTNFHMGWRHVPTNGFRGDYAIDEVRLYVDNVNVETWGFENINDGQGTGGFSGYSGWRHAGNTNTSLSTTAFSQNQALIVSTATGRGRWGVHSGGTGSSSTGPNSAYQGSNYCYTEASSPTGGLGHWLFSEQLTVS